MTARVLPGVAVGEAHAPPPRSPIDLRLILPAASCWLTAGVLVGLSPHWLGAWAPLIAVTLFGFALTLLAFVVFGGFGMHSRFRARRRLLRAAGMGAAVCAAAALACACVGAQVSARSPDDVASLAGHTVTVTLTVGTAAVESEAQGFAGTQSSKRFTATVDEVSAGPSHPTLSGLRMPVLVFLSAPAVGGSAPGSAADSLLDIGTRLRITGTLHPTDPSESVVDLFFADGTPTLVSSAPWMLDWANHLRATFRDSARALPGDGAQLVPGLAIGDVTLVSDELNSAMITSGLSHLTAVSGANCAIVVEAIMLLGGGVGLSRRWRTGLSLTVMGAFIILVTPSSSVLRAAVMALIVLITLASGRQPKGLPALGLATIVLLSADPWFSRNYGLALSVLATGGLLVLTRPLQALLARWLPSTLALVIAVPTAAQIACQPVLVLLSPTISTYSVVANLLAEPAAPVATVVGLVSCVFGAALSGLVPAVGVAGAWLTWVPASWIAGVATFFANLPGASIPWLGGWQGAALVVLVTAAALVALFLGPPLSGIRLGASASTPTAANLRAAPNPRATATFLPANAGAMRNGSPFRRPRPLPRPPRRRVPITRRGVRLAAAALLATAVALYVGTAVGTTVTGGVAWPANWQIAACDIGQGDAVVVHDQDTYALIDVGPDPALLTVCLHRLGIQSIDLLVLTHYDLDHVGGLDAVLGHVGIVLMGPPEDSRDAAMAGRLTAAGADVRQARQGDTGVLGGLAWNVLWPQQGTALRGNDASVTVQFTGSIRSLFLGDLGEDAQRMVMSANQLEGEDVVKVAHHGSADQSEDFYQAITAKVGLISVGMNNRYGHPTDRLLSILARAHTEAYRTDLLGMIVLAPSPDGIVVWSDGQARVEKKK